MYFGVLYLKSSYRVVKMIKFSTFKGIFRCKLVIVGKNNRTFQYYQ